MPSRRRGHGCGGHVSVESGQVPPVWMGALARPGGQTAAADEVGAQGHSRDELTAAHAPHVLGHGQRRGDGDHSRMHDGVFVDVVEIERVRHGGVHLRGVGRGHPVAPAKDACSAGPRPTPTPDPASRPRRLRRSAQGHPEEVQHLVLGYLDHLWGKVLVPDALEVLDEQLRGVGSRVIGAGVGHDVLSFCMGPGERRRLAQKRPRQREVKVDGGEHRPQLLAHLRRSR